MTTKRAGTPLRGRPATIAWLTEADLTAARERWPTWSIGSTLTSLTTRGEHG